MTAGARAPSAAGSLRLTGLTGLVLLQQQLNLCLNSSQCRLTLSRRRLTPDNRLVKSFFELVVGV